MLEIRKRRLGKERSVHERLQQRQTLRRVTTTVTILLLLFVIGFVVYVWYMGQHPLGTGSAPVDTSSIAPKVKTFTPPPDATIGIVQQTFVGTVTPPANASISVKTNPGAACQIGVTINNNKTPLKDSGLVPKIADEFGIVSWSWTVPTGVLPGKSPVEITCANAAKHSAYYNVDLTVTQ